MKNAFKSLLTVLAVAIGAPLAAQQKIAEGEYQLSRANANAQHQQWVLTTRPSGGYFLRSEIPTPQNGTRVLQIEELNDHLVPTRIAYELYMKGRTEPNVIVSCTFANSYVSCDGKSEKGTAPRSAAYPCKVAILFSVRDLAHFDFPWLMASALNAAEFTSGKARLRTIHLTGGAALELTDDINVAELQAVMTPSQKLTVVRPESYTEWEFMSDDDDVETLTFIGTDQLELNGAKVPARHYSLGSGDEATDFWLAAPGILLKMSMGSETQYLLSNYHQFRKLIPEIKTEDDSPEKRATAPNL